MNFLPLLGTLIYMIARPTVTMIARPAVTPVDIRMFTMIAANDSVGQQKNPDSVHVLRRAGEALTLRQWVNRLLSCSTVEFGFVIVVSKAARAQSSTDRSLQSCWSAPSTDGESSSPQATAAMPRTSTIPATTSHVFVMFRGGLTGSN